MEVLAVEDSQQIVCSAQAAACGGAGPGSAGRSAAGGARGPRPFGARAAASGPPAWGRGRASRAGRRRVRGSLPPAGCISGTDSRPAAKHDQHDRPSLPERRERDGHAVQTVLHVTGARPSRRRDGQRHGSRAGSARDIPPQRIGEVVGHLARLVLRVPVVDVEVVRPTPRSLVSRSGAPRVLRAIGLVDAVVDRPRKGCRMAPACGKSR